MNATLLHGTEHDVDDMHVWIYLLLHVVVLVVDFCRNSSLAILLVHLLDAVFDEILASFKLLSVVVADDVAELGFLAAAFDAEQVVEALVTICLFRIYGLR